MKFKKFLAVLSSAALSLSLFAAVNVSAEGEMIDGADPSSRPYSFDYAVAKGGVVITNVTVAEGIDEIFIPDENEDGIKIVGVEDFAFKNADVSTIICPDTFKLANIGPVAFLSARDIEDFLIANGQDQKLSTGLTYAANTVKFMDKDDWKGNEEELQAAQTVLEGIKETAGIDGDSISAEQAAYLAARLYVADVSGEKPYYVREDGVEDTTKMSEKSFTNFQAWVKTIPVHVTIKGNEGSDAQKYAEGKALLDFNFEVNEPEEEHLIGDANQDGEVNVRDCATIAKAMANKDKFDKIITCTICADYNTDGEVNVRDAAALAHDIATGKIDTSKK